MCVRRSLDVETPSYSHAGFCLDVFKQRLTCDRQSFDIA